MQFPLFISIEGKKIVVVGAGTIAYRRIRTLLAFSPQIVVISPEISKDCRRLQASEPKERLLFLERSYKEGDLKGAYLVLACTNQADVNEAVAIEARQKGILVNRCDKKEECDFYFPGIAQKGNLVAGVTAGGKNHGLAKQAVKAIRELFETMGIKG